MFRNPPPQLRLNIDNEAEQQYWLLVDKIILEKIKADREICQFYKATKWTVSDATKTRIEAIKDQFEGYSYLENLIREAQFQADKAWHKIHRRNTPRKHPAPFIPIWILEDENIINNLFQYKCNQPILLIMVIAGKYSEEGESPWTVVPRDHSFLMGVWKEAIVTVNQTLIKNSAKYPHLTGRQINVRNLNQREIRQLFQELSDWGIYPEYEYKGLHGAKYSVTGYIGKAGNFPARRYSYPLKTKKMEKAMREIYVNRKIREKQLGKT